MIKKNPDPFFFVKRKSLEALSQEAIETKSLVYEFDFISGTTPIPFGVHPPAKDKPFLAFVDNFF